MQFSPGDFVRVRGRRWVVDEATTFADCVALSLSTLDALDERRCCRLLLPFDRPIESGGSANVRAVTRRRWMHSLGAHLAELRTFGQLRSAAPAAIDILPFQLEPALALLTGRASRFLLADEVGLGKTIQAGLMIAELQNQGWCEHALVLTPSGLRQQWAGELQRRFAVRSAVFDAAVLSTLAASLPLDVNPWTVEPVVIASIDFIKQPEVLRGAAAQLWDLLIVDEAHRASMPSLRYEAVSVLANRSRHVVLLTATPHAGDEAAYRALCDIGRIDREDPILLFRRTREQTGMPRTRRVHLLPVRLAPDAVDMHRTLAAYVARLWQIAQSAGRRDVQLVAMVLGKRAFSCAWSLAASVERRLGAISGSLPAPVQWTLPFDLDADPSDEAPYPVVPAFDRPDEEAATLRQLLDAARRAQADDRKLSALRRLLRRVKEPVIVFTEYRDTLEALTNAIGSLRTTTTLHGGQTPQERREAVDAFTDGAADLLLATDAGAEGLNLQSRCRIVVNLELPWNPIRLEQRIGRVDRIGQTRTVHAINLFAEGTAEGTVLAGLFRRLDRIHASEIEIAASVISRAAPPLRHAGVTSEGGTATVDLKASARTEATRIRTTRTMRQAHTRVDDDPIPVTSVRSRVLGSVDHKLGPFALRPFAIWFVRVRIANRAGRLVEDALVPVAMQITDRGAAEAGNRAMRRRDIRATAEQAIEADASEVVGFVARLGNERAVTIGAESAAWVARSLRREGYLSRAATANPTPLIQVGLFDRRAMQSKEILELRRHNIIDECAHRSALLEAGATACLAGEPRIALILLAC